MKPPIVLNDAYKTVREDQDKIISPAETVRGFKKRLQTLELDLLKQTVRIDNGRLNIPVFFSQCGIDAVRVMGTRKQMGKGATPDQAEASAVMELAERFSFFSFSQNPDNFIMGTHRDMGSAAMPFEWIAKSVHDDSPDLNVARNVFEDLPMRWTWGTHLARSENLLIPFDWFFAINEFNGPSAGNCPEEAICQGICEVVERHVCSIVSRNRITPKAIAPGSATDPLVREMIEKYRRNGIILRLSDFTLDMGIPTVGVMAYDPTTFPEKSEIVWTAGTTPNPEKALSRALTETAQLAGDFNTGSNYVASGLPKLTDLDQASFIMSSTPDRDIRALPDLSHENIRVEIERLTSALSTRGLDVFVVDTRHPRLNVPAFYTIIPGAHFRERTAGTSVGMFTAKLVLKNRQPPSALTHLQAIDAMMPGKYYLSFYMGSARLAMTDPEGALVDFTRALGMDPNPEDVPSIYSYMGVCLKDLSRYQEALSVLEKGAALDPERTDIHNLMGFCHFKRKDHQNAIACFQKVLDLDPSSAIDYANIASNYRDMGQRQEAVVYYRKALEIDPEIDFAKENLFKLLIKTPDT